MGALGLCVLNFWRTRGRTIVFGQLWISVVLSPLATVVLASLIGLPLWGLMIGALNALSWVTSLAAAAAGATGIAGFCWLCLTELTKNGAENAITPRI